MSRKEPMKVGNVYRCPHFGQGGMVVWLGTVGHERTRAAEVLWADGSRTHEGIEWLREEYEFLGLPAVTFRRKRIDGTVSLTLSVEGCPPLFFSGEEPESLPALRVAAWMARYAPAPPEPEPEAAPLPHGGRTERLVVAHNLRRAWLSGETGQRFQRILTRLENEMTLSGDLTPDIDGLMRPAVLAEFKRHLRDVGGWKAFQGIVWPVEGAS